ncbi:MAG: hypothetical protein CVU41_16660 [Chloroflexi bacterium HGW-Chloroflexi-3]|nr:MAG: hypothetical protein CVU41_16660 [Chloroflexi bacterium HGW-Chloroflexi-3]
MTGIKKRFLPLAISWVLVLTLFGSLQIVQAAVTLVSLDAYPGNHQVILEWETATEADMLGFYITRNGQPNGNYTRVSPFIFTQGSPVSGLVYQYIDVNVINGQTYYYKLEAVDNSYNSEYFGPVSAIPMQITATQTQTLTQTSSTQSLTLTSTPTITLTPTINLTHSKTPTRTSTSPFSFVTNTPTMTFTPTPRISPTDTRTDTPDFTSTPEITRTLKIISYNVFTPTVTPEPEEVSPFRQGLIGFMITIVIGFLFIITVIIIQRNHTSL